MCVCLRCLYPLPILNDDLLQEMIEQVVHWNEDIGEWQLKCVAYTGNNMRKQTPLPDKDPVKVRCSEQKMVADFVLTKTLLKSM